MRRYRERSWEHGAQPTAAQLRRRARALDFSDRHRPGAEQFNSGPLLPHRSRAQSKTWG